MSAEVNEDLAFGFGKNWQAFLNVLNDARIEEAERSLKEMLQVDRIEGKTFLDIGSGSGLFSLAARRLGAKVHSFDYDSDSVACALELKRRYFPNDRDWTIEQGSVLDADFLRSLGTFDVVYSWGVLHHTGNMWTALENLPGVVRHEGLLYISIYNDQGWKSRLWVKIKRAYNRLQGRWRHLIVIPTFLILWGPTFLRDTFRGTPLHSWRTYGGVRGMHPWRDLIDWVGGYPFEVAKPEEIFDFFVRKNFVLIGLRTVGGSLGCNEFVFEKKSC